MSTQANTKIDPIPFWQSLLIFGAPGILIFLGVNFLVPILTDNGVPLIFAWSACILIPVVGNAALVLTFYLRKDKPVWREFLKRFRLKKLERRYWWMIPLVFVSILIFNEAMAWTIPLLSEIPLFAPAASAPEIFRDPYEALTSASPTFMGVPLVARNWWLIPFWAIFTVVGVLGEELVWRGYLLPRHEATYGKWAWLVNGLLWNIPYHLYTLSNCFSDMPFYLILPFVVQRIKNTWFAIIIHAMLISMGFVIIFAGMLKT